MTLFFWCLCMQMPEPPQSRHRFCSNNRAARVRSARTTLLASAMGRRSGVRVCRGDNLVASVLADARSAAVFTLAAHAVVLAKTAAAALFTVAPDAIVLAHALAPALAALLARAHMSAATHSRISLAARAAPTWLLRFLCMQMPAPPHSRHE